MRGRRRRRGRRSGGRPRGGRVSGLQCCAWFRGCREQVALFERTAQSCFAVFNLGTLAGDQDRSPTVAKAFSTVYNPQ